MIDNTNRETIKKIKKQFSREYLGSEQAPLLLEVGIGWGRRGSYVIMAGFKSKEGYSSVPDEYQTIVVEKYITEEASAG